MPGAFLSRGLAPCEHDRFASAFLREKKTAENNAQKKPRTVTVRGDRFDTAHALRGRINYNVGG
jgi:hypothetical protein